MSDNRYLRQMMISEIGVEGQKRIRNASILIVGLGGLGSPVALYLTGAGIGRIGLCDADVVSESNLHRQILYDASSIGKKKAEVAEKHLTALSPDTEFETLANGLNEKNAAEIIGRYDLVVDCCDNFPTRYLIDDTCFKLGKQWIYGAVGELTGQLSVFNAESGVRYSDLYPDREYFCSIPRNTLGAFGPVPGTIGSLQAAEAIKQIVGISSLLDGAMLTFDFLSLSTELIQLGN